MPTPNSLYDLYLGDVSSLQGYRCRALIRDSAPLVAPRFSTGAQGETDLDLLKSTSIDNLSGGIFQRTQSDPTKVARAVGYYNAFDENFYPTVPTGSSSGTASSGSVLCKVESELYAFVNYYQRSGGNSYNGITKFVGNTATSLTVPAAIYGPSAQTLTSGMAIHKGNLYLANAPGVVAGVTYTSTNCQRYNIAANTWQDIGGFLSMFFTLRGVLYGVNKDADIYSVTNEFAAGAATFTLVASVGGSDLSPEFALDFNGAAWVTKPDGLYRFDGVSCVKVLPLYAKQLTVWNGALYFMVGQWLYKFDGVNVVKLQYFTDTIYQISTTSTYMFFQTWVTAAYTDSPKVPTGTGFVRIYSFDGIGFGIALEKDMTISSSIAHSMIYSSGVLMYAQPQFNGTAWSGTNLYPITLSSIFSSAAVTSTSQLDVTSSEDDDGFPNIYKSLEFIELNYRDMVVGDVITVKYQLYNGKTWGSWLTAGTLTSTSENRIEITDLANKLYKRVKINAYVSTMTAASTISMKGFSWRYTLQPRVRWRWQATLMAAGNSVVSDRNNTMLSSDSNALTNSVIRAVKQKTPLYMLSPDYGLVKTQVNSAALSFVVKGQVPVYADPYNEYPLVSVINNNTVWEILRVSAVSYNAGTDESTLTVLERGYLGVTPAQINANAEFHLCYKVYANRLIRENVTLDENTYNEQAGTGESQLQREFMLEIIEV